MLTNIQIHHILLTSYSLIKLQPFFKGFEKVNFRSNLFFDFELFTIV